MGLCLLPARPHPWVANLLPSIYTSGLNDIFKRFPIPRTWLFSMVPKKMMDQKRLIEEWARGLIAEYVPYV